MEEIENQELENTSPFFKVLTEKSVKAPTYNMERRSSKDKFIYNTNINESDFDKGLLWGVDVYNQDTSSNLEDYRSKNQPNIYKVGAGLGRAVTKAGVEILKMPGYIAGMPMAVGKTLDEGIDTITNNAWIKSLNSLNESINDELLPVYVKKSVREGNIWDNITSVDFYTTEGADGAGFMMSMFAPGAALKALNVGNALYKGSIKTLAAASKGTQYQKLANAARMAEKAGLSTTKFDVGTATIANTLFESFAEAGGAIDAFDKTKDKFIETRLNEGMSEQEAEEAFKIQKGQLGSNMLISNFILLLGPNAIQSSMIWGKKGSKFLTEKPTAKQWVGNRGKNILGATLSEGFIEEAGQSTVEHYFGEKAASNKLQKGMFNDWDVKGLVDAYLHTVTTTEGQKAMFLGALLGGGMSSYQGHKEERESYKNSQKINTLLQPYQESLKSILEEDNFERDENGIVFDENQKPIVDKLKVLRKMKTLQTLTDNFEAYDQALLTGNVKQANTLRNQAIKELVFEYARQGEIGIDALKSHLETMSQAEDIQEFGDPKELEERKKNIVKYAESVSSKLENYNEIANTMFDITNKDATVEQKKQFFNVLSSSYALMEIEKSQLLTELENVNKKLKMFDYNSISMFSSTEKTLEQTTQITENLNNNNNTFNKLNEEKSEIEKTINLIEKTIVNDYFNNDKINESFDKFVNKEDLTAKEKKLVEQSVEDDKKEEEKLNEQINKLKDPNNFKTIEEFDDFLKTVNNQVNPMDIELARQELTEKLENDRLEKEKANKELNQALNLTPQPTVTTSDTNVIGKNTITIQDTSTDEVIFENGQPVEKEVTPVEAVEVQEVQPENVPGGKNGGSSVISLNMKTGEFIKDKFGKIVEVFKNMWNYERVSRNKLKDDVQFELGNITNPKTQEIFDKLKNDILTKEEKDFLIDNLPIGVTLTSLDKKHTVKSFINQSNGTEAYNNNDKPLRAKIVDALIENKGDFKYIKGIVTKQYGGVLNLDYKDGRKSLKDSNIFVKDDGTKMTEKEIIEYFKNNTYYVNHKGQMVSTKTQLVNDEFQPSIKTQSKGDIYIIITRPNGEKFPLKLNNTRISQAKSDVVIELVKTFINISKIDSSKEVSELTDLEQSLVAFSELGLETLLNGILTPQQMSLISSELSILKNYKEQYDVDLGLSELITLIIHSQNNNPISKFYLNENGLVLGRLIEKLDPVFAEAYSQFENVTGFTYYTLNTLNDLTEAQKDALNKYIQYKKSNILVKLTEEDNGLFNNDNYIKHLLGMNNNEPLLSTNAYDANDTDNSLFKGYTNIVLAHEVNNTKPQPKKKDVEIVEQPPIEYQSPTISTSQSNTDAKKAEIERRRQEEILNRKGNTISQREVERRFIEKRNSDSVQTKLTEGLNYTNGNVNSEKRWIDKEDAIFEELIAIGVKPDNRGVIDNIAINKAFSENESKIRKEVNDEIKQEGLKRVTDEFRKQDDTVKFKEINAKYDAELKALENNLENVRNSENNSVSLSEPIINKDLNKALEPLKPAQELTTEEKIISLQKLMILNLIPSKRWTELKNLKVTDVDKVNKLYDEYKDKIKSDNSELKTKCKK
jgi:hypothetical protein